MMKPSTNADNCRKYRHRLAVEDPLLDQTRKRARKKLRWYRKVPTMEQLLVVASLFFQALSFLLFYTVLPCGNEVPSKMHFLIFILKNPKKMYHYIYIISGGGGGGGGGSCLNVNYFHQIRSRLIFFLFIL